MSPHPTPDLHGGAQVVRVTDLLSAAPALARDLPSVLRGLAIVHTARTSQRLSVGRTFQAMAHRHPERPFLRFAGRDLTYAEANVRANRIAEVLRRHGVRRGDTVGILMTNRPEAVVCMLAVVKLGAVAGLFNHHQRGEVLEHSQGIFDARVVLVGAECSEALDSVDRSRWQGELLGVDVPVDLRHADHAAGVRPGSMSALDWLDEEVTALGATVGATDPPEADATLGRETAFLIFTSGTTGMPKASAMSHHRWTKAMAGFGLSGVRLRGDDVLFCPLPLYHNNALTVALGCVLAAGSCLAIEEHFSARRFWNQVRDSRATAFIYIGEICRYLLNQPERPEEREHRLRLVLGNGLRPEIWDDFRERFAIPRIREFYAASECNIVFVNAFDVDRTAGFCPLSYALVEYDGETAGPRRGDDGRLTRVGRGEVGLLLSEITGSQPFDGYTDAAETEKKVVRDAFADGDAWFVSGDLMLDQGFGHVSFVDRLGDTFRWKGENVATSEVEGAVARRPEIDRAAVYGVALDGADGRAGMAAVLLREGAEFDGRGLAADLRTHLPSYAVPLFVRVVDHLDHTSTYKSRKVELREQGVDTSAYSDALYVLSGDAGYVPAYDGAERDAVAGTVRSG